MEAIDQCRFAFQWNRENSEFELDDDIEENDDFESQFCGGTGCVSDEMPLFLFDPNAVARMETVHQRMIVNRQILGKRSEGCTISR
jgi:hypothetical protein